MSRLPLKIKKRAIYLRLKGYSIKEVASKLGISKSTSSLWLRNIKLDSKAQQRLKKRDLFGRYKTSLRWQEKRIQETKKYKHEALKVIKRIKINSHHTQLYCALLFWCEGGKSGKDGGVRLSNSDPTLIKTFLNLFRKSFIINEKKFRVLMHLHGYHDEKQQKKYWSKITKIPEVQFQKTFHKPHTKKRIRENYQGCISVVYYDTKIEKRLSALYNIFSEYLGA